MALEIIANTKNWPLIIFNYLNPISQKPIDFIFKRDLRIIINKGHGKYETTGLATIWEIVIKKNYNPRGFEIKLKDIIIDIGANIGIFSIYAAKKAIYGKIYSFEPFKSHYRRFLKNIELNKIKNIKPFNLAVSKKEGEQRLFLSEINSGGHSLHPIKGQESVIIKTLTLNKIIKENKLKKIDLLKLDCEGSEYEIIYSTSKKNLKIIKKIVLEYENIDKNKNNLKYLKKFLEKEGFKVLLKDGGNKPQGILHATREFKSLK